MPAPRIAPLVGCPTSGSAAALESRLLKAWRRALFTSSQPTMEAVARFVYGSLATRATKKKPARPFTERETQRALAARIELLDEVVEELVMLLQPAEQQRLAPLLLDRRNMGGFARAVVALNGSGNALYKREPEPKLDDSRAFDVAAKVCGFGKLARVDTAAATAASRKLRGLPGLPTGGEPLVLTPWPVVAQKPALRTAKRRKRRPLARRGQLGLWPPVSVGAGWAGGLS